MQPRFGTSKIEIMTEPRPHRCGILAGLVWIDFPRVEIEHRRRVVQPAGMLHQPLAQPIGQQAKITPPKPVHRSAEL